MASTPAEDTGIIGGVDTHHGFAHRRHCDARRRGARHRIVLHDTSRIPGDACLVPVSRRAAARGGRIHRQLRRRHRPALSAVRSARPRGDRSRPGRAKSQGKGRRTRCGRGRPRRLARDVESKWPRTAAARWRPRGCCARLARPRSSAAGRRCSNSTTRSSPRRTRCVTGSATSPRMRRLRTCAAWRPDAAGYRDPAVATKLSLKSLARRISGPRRRDRRTRPLHRSARRGTRTRSAQARRRGNRQCGRAAGRRGRESRPAALRSELRDAVRCLPTARLER